jgi:antitoxin CptB
MIRTPGETPPWDLTGRSVLPYGEGMAQDGTSDRERRIKKLLFQSRHRGMREADFLIGGFAQRHLAGLPDAQIDAFERLLEEPDPDVVDWILNRAPAPEAHRGPLLQLIKTFKNER